MQQTDISEQEEPNSLQGSSFHPGAVESLQPKVRHFSFSFFSTFFSFFFFSQSDKLIWSFVRTCGLIILLGCVIM